MIIFKFFVKKYYFLKNNNVDNVRQDRFKVDYCLKSKHIDSIYLDRQNEGN